MQINIWKVLAAILLLLIIVLFKNMARYLVDHLISVISKSFRGLLKKLAGTKHSTGAEMVALRGQVETDIEKLNSLVNSQKSMVQEILSGAKGKKDKEYDAKYEMWINAKWQYNQLNSIYQTMLKFHTELLKGDCLKSTAGVIRASMKTIEKMNNKLEKNTLSYADNHEKLLTMHSTPIVNAITRFSDMVKLLKDWLPTCKTEVDCLKMYATAAPSGYDTAYSKKQFQAEIDGPQEETPKVPGDFVKIIDDYIKGGYKK